MLTPAQLNWKPDADSWSIGECIDHISNTNQTYFDVYEKIGQGIYQPAFWTRISPFSGMFGKMLIAATEPEAKRKSKTVKVFEPSHSELDKAILEKYEVNNGILISLMKAMDGKDLSKIKIPSPAAAIITYSVKDSIILLVNHEKRHYNQAVKVMKNSGFLKLS